MAIKNSCGVLTGFSGNKTFTVKKRPCDENGRILILETFIDNSGFILINFYNVCTESGQIQPFNELNMLPSNLDLSSVKHIIIASDFNQFLHRSLVQRAFKLIELHGFLIQMFKRTHS